VEVWQTSNLRRLRSGEEKKKEERRRKETTGQNIMVCAMATITRAGKDAAVNNFNLP